MKKLNIWLALGATTVVLTIVRVLIGLGMIENHVLMVIVWHMYLIVLWHWIFSNVFKVETLAECADRDGFDASFWPWTRTLLTGVIEGLILIYLLKNPGEVNSLLWLLIASEVVNCMSWGYMIVWSKPRHYNKRYR